MQRCKHVLGRQVRNLHYEKHHIIKSPNDKDREYASIKLSNGLDALLISDPATKEASASMDVHVGYFQGTILWVLTF